MGRCQGAGIMPGCQNPTQLWVVAEVTGALQGLRDIWAEPPLEGLEAKGWHWGPGDVPGWRAAGLSQGKGDPQCWDAPNHTPNALLSPLPQNLSGNSSSLEANICVLARALEPPQSR